jgi:hypothetical protein
MNQSRDSRRLRAAIRKVAEERSPENLQGLPARHATTQADKINSDLLAFVKV